MKQTIKNFLTESARIKAAISSDESLVTLIERVGIECRKRLAAGGTIYSCGNGGSTCDAMHFTEELVARYKRERPGIRAMHFMDGATITCWTNDYDFQSVFKRQVETFCGTNDILFGFSTSGNSKNILDAFLAAKNLGTFTVGLLGKDGGKIKGVADISIVVPSMETDRIQEVLITIVHALCEILEKEPIS